MNKDEAKGREKSSSSNLSKPHNSI